MRLSSSNVTLPWSEASTLHSMTIELEPRNRPVNIISSSPNYIESFTSCPPAVSLVALEVTQGTQDWQGSLQLVSNRLTAVRAFFTTETRQQTEIKANLKGTILTTHPTGQTTQQTLPTLQPINTRGSLSVISHEINHTCTYDRKATFAPNCRANIDSSLNFILPQNWINLTSNQTLQLELEPLNNIKISCEEQISPADSCSGVVSFVTIDAPRIVMYAPPLEIIDEINDERIILRLSREDLVDQFNRISAIMPFPTRLENNEVWFPDSFLTLEKTAEIPSTEPTIEESSDFLESFNDRLTNLRRASDDWDAIYLAVFPIAYGDVAGLANDIPGWAASWFERSISPSLGTIEAMFGSVRNTGAHELGHTLGLRHPVRYPRTGDANSGSLLGVCSEGVSHVEEEYPYLGDPYPQNSDDPNRPYEQNDDDENSIDFFEDEKVALLGPLGNATVQIGTSDTEIWGLDIVKLQNRTLPTVQSSSLLDTLIVSDPREVYSVMSYCRGRAFNLSEIEDSTQSQWLDAHNHDYLVNNANDIVANLRSLDPDAPDISKLNTELFSGQIAFSSSDSSVATGVELDRVYSRIREPRKILPGDFVLELRNNNGTVLHSIPFAASRPVATVIGGGDVEFDSADFGLLVYNPPDYTSFAIKQGNRELIAVQRSSNAPTVSLSGISANQEFTSSDTINLSWTGNDADMDSLTYRLFYSTDGGSSYRPFLLETNNTSQAIEADWLLGSDTARFGISVSDSTRSTFTESPIFSVAGHVPEITIETPSPNMVFAENQGFVLEALGIDREDGLLGHSAFSWRSNLDGSLGTGRYIVLSADQLTAGTHTVTVTGTDSASMSATATINIVISRVNIMPKAVNDTLSVELDIPVFADVLANDIDIEGDIIPQSFQIIRSPQLGEAEVAFAPSGRLAISYMAHTSGRDSLEYKICDGLLRCDRATVSIESGIANCTIVGTEGNDTLIGTNGADVICGFGGDDFIDGRSGDDKILGGAGDDRLYGRVGNDIIRGGLGNDLILGHRNNDRIYGGLGDDRAYGAGGNDTIEGGPGDDRLFGDDDNDTIEGGEGSDLIHGGWGDDVIRGGPGNDTIRGNAGFDVIYRELATDTILGVSHEDFVIYETYRTRGQR